MQKKGHTIQSHSVILQVQYLQVNNIPHNIYKFIQTSWEKQYKSQEEIIAFCLNPIIKYL